LADDLAVGIFHEGMVELDDDVLFIVGAQSRNRLITPEDDNFGFARWVRDNKQALALHLGEGIHYGEWWGSGIQRGYGLEKGTKRFSLFNVKRYADVYLPEIGLGLVPVLYEGQFSTDQVEVIVDSLALLGSAGGYRVHESRKASWSSSPPPTVSSRSPSRTTSSRRNRRHDLPHAGLVLRATRALLRRRGL